jgi:hypothetical protein
MHEGETLFRRDRRSRLGKASLQEVDARGVSNQGADDIVAANLLHVGDPQQEAREIETVVLVAGDPEALERLEALRRPISESGTAWTKRMPLRLTRSSPKRRKTERNRRCARVA